MSDHEAFAAFPPSGGTATDRDLQRAYVVKRTALCLSAAESLQTINVVDPDAGSIPLYVVQNARLFEYMPLDASTAHDGTTCLVSLDGKRYQVATFDYPHSVLDKDLTSPPESPEASVGDAYIVATAATGDWAGQDDKIAVQTERGWQFCTIPIGKLIYVEDEAAVYHRNTSGTWTAGVGSIAIGSGVVLASNINAGGGNLRHIVENQTTNAPPGTVVDGVKYIIGPSPTDAWSGHAAKIAIGENGAWVVYTPAEGWVAYDKALNNDYRYTGSAWESLAGAWLYYDIASNDDTSNTTEVGSGSYSYSAGTAPTSATKHRLDGVTITRASVSDRKLRFRYRAVTALNERFVIGLYRDSDSAALDWVVTVTSVTDVIDVELFATAADSSSHTWKIRICIHAGSSDPGANFSRRRLTIEEAG